MALRVDRPAGGAGDEVVVFVARSRDEANAARAALEAAGIACPLPEAAVAALFDQGATSVPVRVASRDFSRAMDVIDARFPPPEPVDLPPEPEKRTIVLKDGAPDAPDDDDDDEPSPRELDEAAARAQGLRLEKTALKVGGIAIGGLLLPGLGAPFSALAVAAAVWCLRRAPMFPDSTSKIRTRAGLALALAVAGLAMSALAVAEMLRN